MQTYVGITSLGSQLSSLITIKYQSLVNGSIENVRLHFRFEAQLSKIGVANKKNVNDGLIIMVNYSGD